MSKKSRPHRGAPAGRPGSSQAGSSQAGSGQAGSSQARGRAGSGQPGPEESEADAIVRRVLGDLWKAVAAGEPLQAEIESSTCMEIPRVLGVRDVAEEEQFRATVLVDGARRRRNPDGAALLRLLMAMGTATTKRAASRALAELTGEGVYPPEWVTGIGKAAVTTRPSPSRSRTASPSTASWCRWTWPGSRSPSRPGCRPTSSG
jgi:hypothetical protein